MSRLDNDRYLIANYTDVFLFDRSSGALDELTVDMGHEFDSEFVPTAIAVREDGRRILIANYRGNSVLLAEVDAGKKTLTVRGRLGDKSTLSPEGVAASGDLIAVANDDGGSVQVFDASQPDAARCAAPLPMAHGILIMGGSIYASSLQERSIVKIDPSTCAVVARTGSSGWGPGQFLWPTGLSQWDEHRIAVSDAHTGLISVLDAESLRFLRSFGGNGPGQNGLNMPYGLDAGGRDVIVTSTFSSRLVAFDKDKGVVTESWALKPQWQYLANGSDEFIGRERRLGYIREDAAIEIDGKCYHPAYAELVACDGARSLTLSKVGVSYMYFVETAMTRGGVLVFSPQCPDGLLYARDGSRPRIAHIGLDHWMIDQTVVGPDGPLDLDRLDRAPRGQTISMRRGHGI
jgi:hypothetical protein